MGFIEIHDNGVTFRRIVIIRQIQQSPVAFSLEICPLDQFHRTPAVILLLRVRVCYLHGTDEIGFTPPDITEFMVILTNVHAIFPVIGHLIKIQGIRPFHQFTDFAGGSQHVNPLVESFGIPCFQQNILFRVNPLGIVIRFQQTQRGIIFPSPAVREGIHCIFTRQIYHPHIIPIIQNHFISPVKPSGDAI